MSKLHRYAIIHQYNRQKNRFLRFLPKTPLMQRDQIPGLFLSIRRDMPSSAVGASIRPYEPTCVGVGRSFWKIRYPHRILLSHLPAHVNALFYAHQFFTHFITITIDLYFICGRHTYLLGSCVRGSSRLVICFPVPFGFFAEMRQSPDSITE